MLLAARALQGAFGALLAPAALSLLTTTFTEPRERDKAFGVFGAIAGSGGAVGLLLGGVLTEYLAWRWCLYVNLFLALPVTVGAVLLVPAQQLPEQAQPGPAGRGRGGRRPVPARLRLRPRRDQRLGLRPDDRLARRRRRAARAFVLIERRSRHPLLPLRVLKDRTAGGSYLAILIAGIGMFGVFLFLTYYLQQNLGYSPVMTGFAFLPMIGSVIATSVGVNSSAAAPSSGRGR